MSSSFARLLGYGGVTGAIEHHNSRPAYLLKRAEQTLTGMYLERCRSRGLRLSLSQLFLLCAIDAEPGIHQAAAARMAGMDAPTAVVVMRSLLKNGRVERKVSSADRRHQVLAVTDNGRAVQRRALRELSAAAADFLKPIAATDRHRLLELLAIVSSNPKSLAPPLCNRDGGRVAIPKYLPEQAQLGFLTSRCLQVAASLAGPAVETFGLTLRQYVALTVLATLEECDLTRLGRALGADRSSLAHILPALEARSLIRVRRDSETPRSLAIAPTQTGFKLLQRARPAAEKANADILYGLKAPQVKDFLHVLQETLGVHGKLMKVDSAYASTRSNRAAVTKSMSTV